MQIANARAQIFFVSRDARAWASVDAKEEDRMYEDCCFGESISPVQYTVKALVRSTDPESVLMRVV